MLVVSSLVSSQAYAGLLVNPGLAWSIYSFEARQGEDTPNYSGYSPSAVLGYSFGQLLDLGLDLSYTGGSLGKAEFGGERTTLLAYGGVVAARIAESVYLGVTGGHGIYHHLEEMKADELEVKGKWQGPTIGFRLGAFFPSSKTNATQFTFGFLHAIVSPHSSSDGNISEKRRLDQFSIGLSYVFNGYENAMIDNSLFGQYFKSLAIWN